MILILNFSCPLSEENAVGVTFQSHIEYKIIEMFNFRDFINTLRNFEKSVFACIFAKFTYTAK